MNKSTESGETSAHLPTRTTFLCPFTTATGTYACVCYVRICVCMEPVSSWIHSSGGLKNRPSAMRAAPGNLFVVWLSRGTRPTYFISILYRFQHQKALVSRLHVSNVTHSDIRTFILLKSKYTPAQPSPSHRSPLTHSSVMIHSTISANGKIELFWLNMQWFSFLASKRERRGLYRKASTLASNIGENVFFSCGIHWTFWANVFTLLAQSNTRHHAVNCLPNWFLFRINIWIIEIHQSGFSHIYRSD